MFKNRRSDGGGGGKRSLEKAANVKCRKLDELVLPTAKLRFCPEQLQNLNYMFQKKLQEKSASVMDKSLLLARSVTERLVQRLICCAGMIDPRFSSKFLISNHDQLNNNFPSKNLEYLMRIDCLSTPVLFQSDPNPRYSVFETEPDYPAAYARVRLHTTTLKNWGDCANSGGYLRRDKVQAKLVELLAQAATNDSPNSPLNVDESIHCGTPGKIVDAYTLHQILKIPTEQHIFYGPGGNVPRYPDPRDFRLAIVDEPGGIRLKVEFLSPTLSNISISVRILVAIGVDAWPSSTNFPARITLGHTDCLLYHQAAQTGMYLVGYGVQSSAWQIRVPAAQDVILNHYGTNSTIRTILDVLIDTTEEIDNNRDSKTHHQASYKILNKYIFLTMLLKSLEDNSSTPSNDLINWSPMYLSMHVLMILDKVMVALHKQNLTNYFFRKANLIVNPGHLCEDDYFMEANNVKSHLLRLFDEALMSTRGVEEFNKSFTSQESETVLLYKWKELIDSLLPPPGTRGRRFCFAGSKNKQEVAHTEYTTRQLEYISILLENLLNVKQSILSNDSYNIDDSIKSDGHDESHLEDVIFLLVTIMDQARDKYLSLQTNPNIIKNRSKIKAQFNSCTSKLVEVIRKDKEASNFEDDLTLVKVILKWLYKAMDQNKRCLAPILRPYLNTLFATSHSISWHLDFIRQRLNRDEVNAIGSFAQLVNSNKITPAEGLIDAVNKNWIWAKAMLSMVEKNTLRVVFISGRGQVYRHILSLPSYQRNKDGSGSKTLSSQVRRQQTLPANRNYFNTILNQKYKDEYPEIMPQHDILRNSSSLTLILSDTHRRGDHRGYGDILKSLQSMQKLNMFQQVTSNLPQEERVEIMELIQAMQCLSRTKKSTKRWSNTLPQQLHKSKVGPRSEKYTPKEESAGIRLNGETLKNDNKYHTEERNNTLLGNCRAARIREDSSVLLFHDSFRVKSLLNKSESFKF